MLSPPERPVQPARRSVQIRTAPVVSLTLFHVHELCASMKLSRDRCDDRRAGSPSGMTDDQRLGGLIEAFVNRVSHPRGRVLTLMARALVTVPQVILLNFALTIPDSTPSSLAAKMRTSPPSVSQMADRLVKLKLVARAEDRRAAAARRSASRRKEGASSAWLSAVRSAEYRAGAAHRRARGSAPRTGDACRTFACGAESKGA